mmetsp:Transcript_42344/g.90164  ORF Transcript_42344/g.90164 Transcript_42344/m.90164 type:complete len:759 (-) Transcript_42344:106-2382(-)
MSSAIVERVHHDIEIMTKRLELEKRRLQKTEKELINARRTHQAKADLRRPASARADRRPSLTTAARPKSAAGGASRATSAVLTARREAALGAGVPTPFEAETLPVKSLVTRLNAQLGKLDALRDQNLSLRKDVDAIRQKRLQLNGIFDRLGNEIRERTAQLTDFIEETAAGQVVHSDASRRCAVVKQQREAERFAFKKTVMKIRKDMRDYDFEKKEVEVQLKRGDHVTQKKRELIIPEEEMAFSEHSMMRRIMKTAFLNCIQRRHIRQHQKSIEVFEQAFSTIKQSTGISNIDEIVKIFVGLESRSYSLLTYVNQMNREIEALEGLRRGRRNNDIARRHQEEQHEVERQRALCDVQKQLQGTMLENHEGREACAQNREVLQQIRPHLQEIASRIAEECRHLRGTGAPLPGDELPKLPEELRDDTIPEWLDWVDQALGRFRELIPGQEREQAFPATAASKVKQLSPKKVQSLVYPVVRAQDLPCAISQFGDDGNQRTDAQKRRQADLLDEESEEDDFGDRPLMLKEIRQRALQAASRHTTAARGLKGRTSSAHAGDDGSSALGLTGRANAGSMSDGRTLRSRIGTEVSIHEEDWEVLHDGEAPEATDDTAIGEDLEASTEGPPAERRDPQRLADQDVEAQLRAARSRRAELLSQQNDEMNDDDIEACFLKRYKMSKEELQVMADRMGLHLSNLCFLKQEFDQYDEDRSGYIDGNELKGLLKRLGEDLDDEGLEVAFKELDSDGSGEIEFFEFVEWFTAD